MIIIGQDNAQKAAAVSAYLKAHPDITDVIVFAPDNHPFESGYETYNWADIIMYRVFYPLLERIGPNYLIVCSELMRTSNRNDLTYNCMHHYLNQTPHRLIFSWFPIIDDTADVMILADLDHPGRYKGRGASEALGELEMTGIDRRPEICVTPVPVPDDKAYIAERERLFDGLGRKDPDTIPRQLHLWCGRYKKAMISPDRRYLARNSRFKMDNVATYDNAEDAGRISIDLPHRRIDLNDYLTRTKADRIEFLATPFGVDRYYAGELKEWDRKAGDIFAQTGIHQ